MLVKLEIVGQKIEILSKFCVKNFWQTFKYLRVLGFESVFRHVYYFSGNDKDKMNIRGYMHIAYNTAVYTVYVKNFYVHICQFSTFIGEDKLDNFLIGKIRIFCDRIYFYFMDKKLHHKILILKFFEFF